MSSVVVAKVVFNRIPAIARALTRESDLLVQKVAVDMQGYIVHSMEGPRSGRMYSVGGSRHIASSPGQVPARWFGELANSINVKHLYNKAVVSSASAHAPHLEYGTRFMGSRPFMRPAAARFQRIFGRAVEIMVRRATGHQ